MFGHRLTLFDAFGFKVRIDSSWLLMAALIVWSLAVGWFPFAAPGYAKATYWWMGAAGLIGLALSIVVHELAHALVARWTNLQIAGITLFIFGGVAEMTEEPKTPKGEFLMAIAGPVMSVVVSLFCWAAAAGGARLAGNVDNPAVVVLSYLSWVNLLLAGFNMLPAFPLDGGRVLRAALWGWRKDVVWATRWASVSGTVIGLAMMGVGVWNAVNGMLITGLWWGLIGLFVRTAAVQAYQQQIAKQLLADQEVERLMRRDPVAVSPDLTLDRLVEDHFLRNFLKSFPVVDADGRLVGAVDLDAVKAVDRHRWSSTVVGEIMQPCGSAQISVRANAGEALRRMRVGGRSRLMVVEDDKLVGMLSLRDLLQYLEVRSAIDGPLALEKVARRSR